MFPQGAFAIVVLLGASSAAAVLPYAEAQSVDFTGSGDPCIFNATAPQRMLQNCDPRGEWLQWSLTGWEWVTGGNFSILLASVIVLTVWVAYRQAIYAIFVGLMFAPLVFYLFPDSFVSFGILMTALCVGILIWTVVTKQTSESA